MAIYALGDLVPTIDPDAYVHPDAVVIGLVTLGAGASVWPTAVLRADLGRIVVGPRTSIQDGTIVHCTPDEPTLVGSDCVVGHNVHMEGCTIEDRVLIGSGSVVLNRAVVRTGSVVAAQALVRHGQEVPTGHTAYGVPAQIRPGGVNVEGIRGGAEHYVVEGRRYRAELRRLD